MDYTIVYGQDYDYVFYPGTYWVQSDFDVSGATFYPGAVIKYSLGTSLYVNSYASFAGGDSVTFTAVDDNSIGESLGSGNPQGYYAAWALYCYYIYPPFAAQNVDVRFAQNGIYCYIADSTFSYTALTHCGLGFYADQCTMTLNYPVSMCDVQTWYDSSGNHGGWGVIVNNGVSDVCGPDSDSDGLPDSWEWQYFGNLSQGPTDNPDGDGLTNYEEWLYGTNPTLPDSDSDGILDGTIVVTNIKFNYDTTSSDYDGINIRQDPSTPLSSEWVKGSLNQPVCYRANLGVRVKARITIEGPAVSSATISGTSLDSDGSLGNANPTTVNFVNGISSPEYVTFYVTGTTPNCIKKTTTDVWQWKISNVNGSGSDAKNINQSGPHTVYTILGQPLGPVAEPGIEWGLDCACTWAVGESSANGTAEALLAHGFAEHYSWNFQCHRLSSDFTRMMLSVGLPATQHTWSSKASAVGDMWSQRTIPFDPVGWRTYQAYEWFWHQWSESGGYQRDPSAAFSLSGNWGAYEDYLFSHYQILTNSTLIWVPNQPGQGVGCEQYPQHCDYRSGELCSPWTMQMCDWLGPDH